ncbi:tRNA1(Val) (adenine(37)-N6)-methyltransferase [Petrocella atlantisensis]|uniref:tRNA1(Val) (Adenine(37)-N6)-methyltransferase n=1 Tax=Petrocella atlantisensis TaxID=2173034 RepID=A0A3P7S5J1_9FIRM|nr:tRNA1(Val) (adenine(37)-N6)-methyltransferase [Petrocella atlantisensis]MCF8020396.1 tRNA1(Val) (adenine(37)-N6)-methyltransferase [Vallitaleaceae bacterium]PKM54768.1 MAG: SAM-dependent methyltransferase [Firmicutes bacterium HGW-Firmicutes-5]VDN47709.1 tRNA1(Val) (adenine(37)-N6)-methyltransferase [Petrocella atlantisensis]
MIEELKPEERLDDLHRKGYKIIQNEAMFCFGMDAVLLAGFCNIKTTDVVLDLGTGNGIIPLLLEGRFGPKQITGLEIQEANVDMAKRSILMNQLDEKIKIIHGDIKEAENLLPLSNYDVVTCNPPYMDVGKGITNEHSAKTIARHEVLCTLEDVIAQASRLTKVGGRFYLVHRPHRLIDIITLLRIYKMEPKRLKMVHPKVGSEANMVLIESVRGGNPFLKVEKPLIVYTSEGIYTDEIYSIYGY